MGSDQLSLMCTLLVLNNPLPSPHTHIAPSEGNYMYTHIEKEALSLVFGVKKFHQYTCMEDNSVTSEITAQRSDAWTLLRSAYIYTYSVSSKATEMYSKSESLS